MQSPKGSDHINPNLRVSQALQSHLNPEIFVRTGNNDLTRKEQSQPFSENENSQSNYSDEEEKESLLDQVQYSFEEKTKPKTFDGIPKQWHQTIRVKNPETQRVKLYFKCKHPGCGSVFKKSCNLRDHFRKHTGQRPFKCPFCQKTFTQSGNLGRHLKNVHSVSRDSINVQYD